jgi:Carboxypeptidase regulatory-like domain/TonB dependent receptor
MKSRFVFCILGLCVLVSRPLLGQVASATSLVGTVTDASGAVVPGATVAAVQDATKVVYKGQTSSAGDYALPYVSVGTYTISVEAPGFQKFAHSNVLVEVNQTVRTDFTLSLGSLTTEMTVSSAPLAIATDDASLVQTLSTKAIASLPVAGHDVLKLSLTAAGVQQSGDVTVGDPPGESFAGPGTRGEQNDISLDGVTLMNSIHVTVDFPPSPDAIQELSVQTGTYSAQYGGHLGVHVNAVSKAGGNAFHGVVSEALRNDFLNAHSPFDRPGTKKNPLRQNQFGAELDGPVILPHLYNGRNKTFFMFDYQGRRQYSKTAQIFTVLTGPERTGDFSALLTAPKPVKLSDPVNPNCIVKNVIQPQCIDPHSLELLNFMPPLPNLSGLTQNLNFSTGGGNNWDQYISRIDETISDKTQVYFRYAHQNATPYTGAVFFPDTSYTPIKQTNFVLGYTRVFTPNLVNQFLVGRNQVSLRSANGYLVNPSLQSQLSVLNIPGYTNPVGNPGDPTVTISNYTGTGSSARNSSQTDEVRTATDTLSWNHGANNIIAGTDISRIYTTRYAQNSPRGSFTFNGSMTGDAAADFMRGLILSDTTPVPQPQSSGMQWKDDFFVLDKWNVTHNLSLNLGLRYELPTVPVSPSGIANVLNSTGTALTPSTPTPNYQFTQPNHTQWAPRFGFAYRISPSWVVRGGAGIYYSTNTLNPITILSLNPPFAHNFSFNTSRANPVITFSNPNPTSALGTAGPTPDIYTIGPYFPSAMMAQWSLDVERSLWADAGIDLQYQGNHTSHLDTTWQQNAPLPGPGPIQARRPNQHFGNIQQIKNEENSNYDGMNVVFTQRFHRGLSTQLNYTWSHSLDQGLYSTGGGAIVNPYNGNADYGNSNDDIRHRFIGNYVWQMPFFSSASNMILRTVASGWSLSGIVAIQTGNPVNVTISQDQANTGQANQRPNRVGPIHASSCGKVLVGCVNSNAFALPTLYTYGNAARNPFYGPGLINFDTALVKTFSIYESLAFQFRADAYNTFNHTNWGPPNGVWSSPTFGNITTTASNMRVFELMGRLVF